MGSDRLERMKERDKAMRNARDEILRRVGVWLKEAGFSQAGAGHFKRRDNETVCHIGFQKLSSGRNLRVMCHITSDKDDNVSVIGPWNDEYGGKSSPNSRRYHFGWSTHHADIDRCVDEYRRYIDEVVIPWFSGEIKRAAN
jgi:hypothetical protein